MLRFPVNPPPALPPALAAGDPAALALAAGALAPPPDDGDGDEPPEQAARIPLTAAMPAKPAAPFRTSRRVTVRTARSIGDVDRDASDSAMFLLQRATESHRSAAIVRAYGFGCQATSDTILRRSTCERVDLCVTHARSLCDSGCRSPSR